MPSGALFDVVKPFASLFEILIEFDVDDSKACA